MIDGGNHVMTKTDKGHKIGPSRTVGKIAMNGEMVLKRKCNQAMYHNSENVNETMIPKYGKRFTMFQMTRTLLNTMRQYKA